MSHPTRQHLNAYFWCNPLWINALILIVVRAIVEGHTAQGRQGADAIVATGSLWFADMSTNNDFTIHVMGIVVSLYWLIDAVMHNIHTNGCRKP
jgi:hypothetical protein